MITLYTRYEYPVLKSIVNGSSEILDIQGHRLTVRVQLYRLTGLELRDILVNGSDGYKFDGDKIIVGVSLSQTSEHDLNMLTTMSIRKGSYHLHEEGDVYTTTNNPNLTHLVRSNGEKRLLVGAYSKPIEGLVSINDGKPLKEDYSSDDKLAEMLKKHDWYYQYSDSLAVYKNGERQYAEMVARLRELGCKDPAEYLRKYIN